MTETEWLACADPNRMLGFLRGKASDRKLRLFTLTAAGSWRNGPTAKSKENSTPLIGLQKAKSRKASWTMLATRSGGFGHHSGVIEGQIQSSSNFGQITCSERLSRYSSRLILCCGPTTEEWHLFHDKDLDENSCVYVVSQMALLFWGYASGREEGIRLTSRLLRDILGNPFRPISPDPSWLTPKVNSLAATIYVDRASARMPELADALEETCCTSAEVLGHCREPEPHAKGCWVVDLLLSKS